MTDAQNLIVALWEELVSDTDTTTFKILGAGEGETGTPSTGNIQSCLNAKTYKNGKEYVWRGPYELVLKTSAIDRDMLDVLNVSGAKQV